MNFHVCAGETFPLKCPQFFYINKATQTYSSYRFPEVNDLKKLVMTLDGVEITEMVAVESSSGDKIVSCANFLHKDYSKVKCCIFCCRIFSQEMNCMRK